MNILETNEPTEAALNFVRTTTNGTHKLNPDGSFYVNGFIDIYGGSHFRGYKLPVTYSEVTENFLIDGCDNLLTLEGAPPIVGGRVELLNNHSLTSLKGGPKIVKNNYYIIDCPSLTSLQYLSEQIGDENSGIGGTLRVTNCPKIKNYLTVFSIEGLKRVILAIPLMTEIINKHLENPDRDDGMIKCRQELRDSGFGEYARL